MALGFACLEVVLDRGQTEDWFESGFIVSFFSVALVALIAAVFWEWRHPDPVVEIRLLADRNFAIANAYYFLFGFALFGSTVLIPQMLQSLETLDTLSRYFVAHGFTTPDAVLHATAQMARIIQQQAALLGFLDCFWLLGCACLIGAPLVFFSRKFRSASPGAAH